MKNEKKAVSAPATGPDGISARVARFTPANVPGNVLGTGTTPPVGGYRAVVLPRPDATVWVQAIGSDQAGMETWGAAALAALSGDGVERRVEIRRTVEYVVAEIRLPQ